MFILPTYDLNKDIEDYLKTGNYNNYTFGIHKCPDLSLLPFRTKNIEHSSGVTITDFELRRLKIISNTKETIETTSLNTGYIFTNSGINYDYHYFKGINNLSSVETGTYQFYLKDSNDFEFVSDIMYITNDCDAYTGFGDFNNDFNNDFYNFNPYNNLITNGTFDTDLSGWNVHNFLWDSGVADYDGADESGYINQDILEIGKTYRVTLDLTITGTGLNHSFIIYAGTTASSTFTSTEQINIDIICTGNTTFKIYAIDLDSVPDNVTITVDNVEVYEI